MLLQNRVDQLLLKFPWFKNQRSGINPILAGCWSPGSAPLPLPTLTQNAGNLVPVLNAKWKLSWGIKQWIFRCKSNWAFNPSARQASLNWLILHKAVWTALRAKQMGKGNGLRSRRSSEEEDVIHLFFRCKFNHPYLSLIWLCCRTAHPQPFNWMEILLGTCSHLDVVLWNKMRSAYLYHIWRLRNCSVFSSPSSDIFPLLKAELFKLARQAHATMDEVSTVDSNVLQEMKNMPWQKWDAFLSKKRSPVRLDRIRDITSVLQS